MDEWKLSEPQLQLCPRVEQLSPATFYHTSTISDKSSVFKPIGCVWLCLISSTQSYCKPFTWSCPVFSTAAVTPSPFVVMSWLSHF